MKLEIICGAVCKIASETAAFIKKEAAIFKKVNIELPANMKFKASDLSNI